MAPILTRVGQAFGFGASSGGGAGGPSGITATGGSTNTVDPAPDGLSYKVHTFNSSGSFSVSAVCLLYTSPSPRD